MISPSMDKWHTPIPYLFPHKGQSATLSKDEKKGHCKELGERCHPIFDRLGISSCFAIHHSIIYPCTLFGMIG